MTKDCLRKLLLLMVCQADRKGGRFQMAMPLREGDYDWAGRVTRTPIAVNPGAPRGPRWEERKRFGVGNLGPIWYLRCVQGQIHLDTFLFERLYTRMSLEHLEYCHSLTHCTSVENLHSILRYGFIPQKRAVHFHPFPDNHSHHTSGSRSHAPVVCRIKKEAPFHVPRPMEDSLPLCAM